MTSLTEGKMENDKRPCSCGEPLAPRRRKYCERCAQLAARLARIHWKRQQRVRNRGTRAYLDPWRTRTETEAAAREAYNRFMRAYMRGYRERKAVKPGDRTGPKDRRLRAAA
jgi:predicted secreted protein